MDKYYWPVDGDFYNGCEFFSLVLVLFSTASENRIIAGGLLRCPQYKNRVIFTSGFLKQPLVKMDLNLPPLFKISQADFLYNRQRKK